MVRLDPVAVSRLAVPPACAGAALILIRSRARLFVHRRAVHRAPVGRLALGASHCGGVSSQDFQAPEEAQVPAPERETQLSSFFWWESSRFC